MNKIKLIISREYIVKVKKKSFVIMTLIGPLLFAAMIIVPAYLSTLDNESSKEIAYIDDTNVFGQTFENTDKLTFIKLENSSFEEAKDRFYELGHDLILYIPLNVVNSETIQMVSKKDVSLRLQEKITYGMERMIEKEKMLQYNISDSIYKAIRTNIDIQSSIIEEDGEEKESITELSMALGYIGGFMIYMFIFLYGVQVMRGVIEEKTNRIIEVIVSSVKPFQLMMGKVIGIAAVGFTQLILWIILTGGIVTVAQQLPYFKTANQTEIAESMMQSPEIQNVTEELNSSDPGAIFQRILGSINFVAVLGAFLFYFIGGYLLYSAMFAAVGAAVDNETDTQQFMMPITIPLIFGLILMSVVLQNPDGPIAFWASIIPFTSPIVMMVRVPFGVPWHELLISGTLLILTFIGMIWVAGKIYRIGILMYGKKVTYAELWKWIRYKG